MTFLTTAQICQLGKKCSMCEEKATWLDKFDENAPAYCDNHFPGRICKCDICQVDKKINSERKNG